jgi:hypothetical protein
MIRIFKAYVVVLLVAISTAGAEPVKKADLDKLKTKREVANDFMRLAAEHTLKLLKSDAKPEEAPKIKYLEKQLARPDYFKGGTKPEELLDFILWVAEADRLGIALRDEDLNKKLQTEFCGRLNKDARKQIEEAVRKKYSDASPEFIMNSLRDEFRVHLARLALLGEAEEGKKLDKKP